MPFDKAMSRISNKSNYIGTVYSRGLLSFIFRAQPRTALWLGNGEKIYLKKNQKYSLNIAANVWFNKLYVFFSPELEFLKLRKN